ncbi:MAG: TerL protein [Candidatus Saccharibacteria bacterium]|nr:TerL protein [Candidatus Saccharibacteria bacterium]
MARDPKYAWRMKQYYKSHPVQFISRWVDTFDPRNAADRTKMTYMPMVLFQRQIDLVQFLWDCLSGEKGGLIEKSRDMGATWVSCGFSIWLLLFMDGASVGWGSRKEILVDRMGDIDSIFEKLRVILRRLPPQFLPEGWDWNKHSNSMRITNVQNGASITGEAGDAIGRGGRKLIYFKDESAHYEHPESIQSALDDNTRVQIDISSVNGLGNVFHRKAEAAYLWEPGCTIPDARTAKFVMDWREHPLKDAKWYAQRKKKATDEGMLVKFYQEVDRNYASSVEGIIIKPEWVDACIDAHLKLGFDDTGKHVAALDVADGGRDRNAWAHRKGVILKKLKAWDGVDTNLTTQEAYDLAQLIKPVEINYDCIGIGAGVKGDSNRMVREAADDPVIASRVKGVSFVDWNASARPQNPDDHMIRKEDGTPDTESPLNKDYYQNMKAQGWKQLALRAERTYNAVVNGKAHYVEDLLSFDSASIGPEYIAILRKELSQPTMGVTTGRSLLIVNKLGEGVRSPNVGDVVMMVYWPVIRSTYDASLDWVGGLVAA